MTSLLDFAQVICCALSGASWVSVVVCLMAPHTLRWLQVAVLCFAVTITCIAVGLCALSRTAHSQYKTEDRSQSDRKSRNTHEHYHVVNETEKEQLQDVPQGPPMPPVPPMQFFEEDGNGTENVIIS